jgi:hypothetical protein
MDALHAIGLTEGITLEQQIQALEGEGEAKREARLLAETKTMKYQQQIQKQKH